MIGDYIAAGFITAGAGLPLNEKPIPSFLFKP